MKYDSLIPVSRSAHRYFGLYRGGSSIRVVPLTLSLISKFQKKCPEDVVAIAHDDDLQIVENLVRPRQMFEVGATSKTLT